MNNYTYCPICGMPLYLDETVYTKEYEEYAGCVNCANLDEVLNRYSVEEFFFPNKFFHNLSMKGYGD